MRRLAIVLLLVSAGALNATTINFAFGGTNGPLVSGMDPFAWDGVSLAASFDIDNTATPTTCGLNCSAYSALSGTLTVGGSPFAVLTPSATLVLGGPDDILDLTGNIVVAGSLTQFGLSLALPFGTLSPSALTTPPTFAPVSVNPASFFVYTVLSPFRQGTFMPVSGTASAMVPEPGTLTVVGLSAIGLGLVRFRKRRPQ